MCCLLARWLISGSLAILFMCSARAEPLGTTPLVSLRAEHPMIAIFGLPGAAVRSTNRQGWQLSLAQSNQFIGGLHGTDCLPQASCENANDSDAFELLYLDGETSELSLRYQHPVGDCWQGDLTLPFLQHYGGVFDRSIEDWHQVFGMPNAGRDLFASGQITYRYTDASGERLLVDRPQSGVGDVVVSLQRVLDCANSLATPGNASVMRLGLKLPTGSLSELRGSGRVDGFIDIQSPRISTGERWHAAAAAGLMWVGRNPRLPAQESLVAYGTFGLQVNLSTRYHALAQLDWHTPFYRSELPELGEETVVLTAGMRIGLARDQSLELTISEDIKIESAPDIVGRLAWVYHPTAQ